MCVCVSFLPFSFKYLEDLSVVLREFGEGGKRKKKLEMQSVSQNEAGPFIFSARNNLISI